MKKNDKKYEKYRMNKTESGRWIRITFDTKADNEIDKNSEIVRDAINLYGVKGFKMAIKDIATEMVNAEKS